ncbi:MAG: hypothetical protein EZS28_019681 [Streblomastix strix]|uniref:Uncharacterized protein n=1 Tax=Streblomastix strix TaxID=222440 RepID=A0A5J4VQA4_9EUKA|nr:MAG: hypothetical protein EZS28_019681 [Streblomastix strix]
MEYTSRINEGMKQAGVKLDAIEKELSALNIKCPLGIFRMKNNLPPNLIRILNPQQPQIIIGLAKQVGDLISAIRTVDPTRTQLLTELTNMIPLVEKIAFKPQFNGVETLRKWEEKARALNETGRLSDDEKDKFVQDLEYLLASVDAK